jgi:hypothetical protein
MYKEYYLLVLVELPTVEVGIIGKNIGKPKIILNYKVPRDRKKIAKLIGTNSIYNI